MTRCRILAGLVLLTYATTVYAVGPDPEACSGRLKQELTAVHDTYRSVLFGSKPVGSGKFEVLTGGYTDKEREGIFATKRRLTSELVPPLVESFRVYRCRSIGVCSVLSESFGVNGGQVTVQPLGCVDVTTDRYPECYFGPDTGNPEATTAVTELTKQCQVIMDDTLQAERSILKMAVAYDAGYRSVLQMSGMMDWMLEAFPTGALSAVSTMVNMLGKLHQIPCFIGQCDNPHSDYLYPSPP